MLVESIDQWIDLPPESEVQVSSSLGAIKRAFFHLASCLREYYVC